MAKKSKNGTFTLIPKEVPDSVRSKNGIYREIVDTFIESNQPSSLVVIDGIKGRSIFTSLYKTIKRNDISGISVSTRDNVKEVYLVRK